MKPQKGILKVFPSKRQRRVLYLKARGFGDAALWRWVRIAPIRVTAFGPDTHPSRLHLTSNQQQLKNQTAYVVTNAIIVSS